MPDELLTVREVADELRLNQQTVRNMIDRGELAAVRVGSRRVRVRRSELDRFLDAGSGSAAAPTPVVDEGSLVSWATFGAAMAEASAATTSEDPMRLAEVLGDLSKAAEDLAAALRARQD